MKHSKIKILVVEDDRNAAFLLTENLKLSNYSVVNAYNGEEGLNIFLRNNFDLCILDVMMPIRDGLDLAKQIRKNNSTIPIIFLTAKAVKEDIIEGFKLGCDDYITKPYDIDELIVRVGAIIRRINLNTNNGSANSDVVGNGFVFNYSRGFIKIEDKKIHISTKESEIIKCLIDNQGSTVSRSFIMLKTWGDEDQYISKRLDVHLTKIRKYLQNSDTIELVNVHGKGYKLILS